VTIRVSAAAIDREEIEHADRQQCAGKAACGEPADDVPADVATTLMNDDAARFRERRVQQVRSDGGCRCDAEDQHEQRRHQRPASDAGHADDGPDGESRECVGEAQRRRARFRRARFKVCKSPLVRW
jgi:hypothetical protein